MKPKDEYSEYLTYQQAADRLGCSTKTIQRLVSRGELKAHRRPGMPGRSRVVLAADIEELAKPKPIGQEEQ